MEIRDFLKKNISQITPFYSTLLQNDIPGFIMFTNLIQVSWTMAHTPETWYSKSEIQTKGPNYELQHLVAQWEK